MILCHLYWICPVIIWQQRYIRFYFQHLQTEVQIPAQEVGLRKITVLIQGTVKMRKIHLHLLRMIR